MSTHTHHAHDDRGWNYCHTVQVRFRDIDMFDHLNNAAYLTYVESARIAYYAHVSGLTDPHDFDMTVARAEIDFLKPVFFPATVDVHTRATRIGRSSWTLEHELRDADNNDLLAHCLIVLVHFDHETGESKPLPEDIIAAIERQEGKRLRQ